MGRCSKCGGDIILVYADRIYKVGHCIKCGLDSKGCIPKEVTDHAALKKLVDKAYNEVSKHRKHVPSGAFFQVVNKLCARSLGGHFPQLPIDTLKRWGYHIEAGYIYKHTR
jgi:hypothetical protein